MICVCLLAQQELYTSVNINELVICLDFFKMTITVYISEIFYIHKKYFTCILKFINKYVCNSC